MLETVDILNLDYVLYKELLVFNIQGLRHWVARIQALENHFVAKIICGKDHLWQRSFCGKDTSIRKSFCGKNSILLLKCVDIFKPKLKHKN